MHLLPTHPRRLLGAALAVSAALSLAGSAQAAPAAVERSGDTALNFTMQGEAVGPNFALPAQEVALDYARKAGG